MIHTWWLFNSLYFQPTDGARGKSQQLIPGQSVVESMFNGLLCSGYRVSAWEDEKLLKTDSGHDCIMM